MINITLNKVGKRFNREWIFRNLDYEIHSGDKVVILGGNGSGKSTLLQTIAGYITANEGKLSYRNGTVSVSHEEIYRHVSFASPYLQLVEEFTLTELIEHSKVYKPFAGDLKTSDIIQLLELQQASGKYIRQFSSGMKQRVKLGLALLAETSVVMLDEPCSNLDRKAIDWYGNLVNSFAKNKTVLVCSNAISEEYSFCDKSLDIHKFK